MVKPFKPRLEVRAAVAVGLLCVVLVVASVGTTSLIGPRVALLLGSGIGGLGIALSFAMGRRIAVPLRDLVDSLDEIGRNPAKTQLPWIGGTEEVLALSASLRSLLRRTGLGGACAASADDAQDDISAQTVKAFRALQRDAYVDPMTGLFNLRGFLTLAEDAIPYFKRYGRTAAIMIVDLDGFKTIDGEVPHPEVDKAIRHVADVLSLSVRVTDKVSRFGAQDFIILLREIDSEHAVALADRMRASVNALPLRAADRIMPMSVSIGVAAISPSDKDIHALIERADHALYAAKKAGGNRVELGHPLDRTDLEQAA